MDNLSLQNYRDHIMSTMPSSMAIYVLCDFFHAPLYTGAGIDVRDRLRRHITSARSDVIANRFISVDEIGFIDLYFPETAFDFKRLEAERIFTLNAHRPLFNVKIPKVCPKVNVPVPVSFQLIPNEELARLRQPTNVIRHQSSMSNMLMDYIHTTKDNAATRKAFQVRQNLLTYHTNNWMADASI